MGKHNKKNVSQTDLAIVLNHIPKGRENAIKHDALMNKTNMSDRRLRLVIEVARLDHCIINNQDGRGYYIAKNKEEAIRYQKQEEARAKSILKRLKGTKVFIKSIEGQQQLNV